MLFSSLVFVFGFLPVALFGFFLTTKMGRRAAALWLIAASLVFYGWWNPAAVVLLLASIAANYALGTLVLLTEDRPPLQTALTLAGVAFNLTALFYYKYLFAVVAFIHGFVPAVAPVDPIALPLGISFFTFTQIGYLADCKAGLTRDRDPLNYVLFVTFFPHLIAGPILHNRDIMPQFADPQTYRLRAENLSVGLTIFVIGLVKKVVLADPLSGIVRDGYAATSGLDAAAAWNLALCYSLQLYFDFSGYSDMAIGLARMVNVRFPRNFDSPYKARNLIEYWQRWHITLTNFLTSYLYSPVALWIMRFRSRRRLGVNRMAQQTVPGFAGMFVLPLMLTMTLAGIWHGAGLTFLVFGLLHGFYLCVCHAWRLLRPGQRKPSWAGRLGACALTYLCVLVASVFFRAPSIASAMEVLTGMAGMRGISDGGFDRLHVLHLLALYAIVWLCPNTQQIMARHSPVIGQVDQPNRGLALHWSPNLACGALVGIGAVVGILALGGTTEFLYFQF